MTTFQKILLAIPILLYYCITCFIAYYAKSDIPFLLVLNILVPAILFMVLLFFSLSLNTLSAQRISVTGGAIISIWSLMIFGGAWIFWELRTDSARSNTENPDTDSSQWHQEYTGREKEIDEAAKKYADANFYPQEPHSYYSQVLKEIANDPRHYAIFGFYTAQTDYPGRPLLSVCMLSDTNGMVTAHCEIDLDSNSAALSIYKHWAVSRLCADKMIHSGKDMNEGTRAMNADDSAYVLADQALERDTIRTNDLPQCLSLQ